MASTQVTSELVQTVERQMLSQPEAWRKVLDATVSRSVRDLPLRAPERLILFGVGSSHHAAQIARAILSQFRGERSCPVVACSSTQIGMDVVPGRRDWVVGISHRGNSEVTLRAMDRIRHHASWSAWVCARGVQPNIDVPVTLETCELEPVEPHTVSLTSAICAITALLGGRECEEAWLKWMPEMQTLLEAGSAERSQSAPSALVPPSAVVGEWDAEWIARECALKVIELTGHPTRAYGAEEFGHGPLQNLRESDTFWHFVAPNDPRTGFYRSRAAMQVEWDQDANRAHEILKALLMAQGLALRAALGLLR